MLNKKLKEARLKKDNHECQLSKLFGIAKLSKKPCNEDLEQHHISYDNYKHENIKDIITVCKRCHNILTDAIRRERYIVKCSIKNPLLMKGLCVNLKPFNNKFSSKGVSNVSDIKVSDNRGSTFTNAQPEVSKSIRPHCKEHQGNILKKSQD